MTKDATCPLPTAGSQTGLAVPKASRDRSLLSAMSLMHKHVGTAFQITLPVFRPVVFIGPESNRQILVSERQNLRWRPEDDPVTELLHQGVLVIDGDLHDEVRGWMDPPLQRRNVTPHIPAFWRYTDDVAHTWKDGQVHDMLVEMRRVALLILFGTLFDVDFMPDMQRMWQPIMHLLEYISPGLWTSGRACHDLCTARPKRRWMTIYTGSSANVAASWRSSASNLRPATCSAN